jgi:hypothetical protein
MLRKNSQNGMKIDHHPEGRCDYRLSPQPVEVAQPEEPKLSCFRF